MITMIYDFSLYIRDLTRDTHNTSAMCDAINFSKLAAKVSDCPEVNANYQSTRD